ncbi:DUF116 domain-containing protein [Christensenellaceae bacterium OttesenSCG-928-K19]|nr:DUF116 domain-containing protein [Christensenellaceae bacterium OttesenSCG-928-K19]
MFIILVAICVAGIGALVGGVLYMLLNVENDAFRWVLVALCLLAVLVVVLFLLGIFTMVFSARSKKPLGKAGRFFMRRVFALYPAAIGLGRVFGISKSDVQESYVNMNNRLVRSCRLALQGTEIAVLAPHCLQKNTCNLRVTQDVANCQECGKCDIAALKQLCGRLGVHLVVVTGGTLARNHVKAVRPKAIVAVACERDLSSGIMDVFPIPSLGVKNKRPEGPCVNTRVDVDNVEEAIRFFLKDQP